MGIFFPMEFFALNCDWWSLSRLMWPIPRDDTSCWLWRWHLMPQPAVHGLAELSIINLYWGARLVMHVRRVTNGVHWALWPLALTSWVPATKPWLHPLLTQWLLQGLHLTPNYTPPCLPASQYWHQHHSLPNTQVSTPSTTLTNIL